MSSNDAPPETNRPLRILIATDACRPQVNGVSRTIEWLAAEGPALGVEIGLLTSEGFTTFATPSYPTLRLALPAPAQIALRIETFAPDAIHIATEGPIGFMARRYCLRKGRSFTTCYHTRLPEYVAARWPIPLSASYAALRRFHNAGAATMVSSEAMKSELAARGFDKLVLWRRGVPIQNFIGGAADRLPWPRPIFLFVGRVAIEKNIEAFLRLELPGTKVVAGDGPARRDLERRFPEAHFLGQCEGADLASVYASADAFVFPSLTDTFGLAMLEACAAGVPVAAYPVTGPRDVIGNSGCGALDRDLRAAALAALRIPREKCRAYAARFTMRASAREFVGNIARAMRLKGDRALLQAAD